MSEFGKPDQPRDLAMDLPVNDFNTALVETTERYSDDFAYTLYQDCLDDSLGYDQEDETIKFKRGMLLKASGEIEQRRGDHMDALASFQQARGEIIGFDEVYSLELLVGEAHLLMHELDDPAAAIEPYETAARIFEANFAGPDITKIATDQTFTGYSDVLSHLAAAHQHTGNREKVRQISAKLSRFGRLSGAIFGFDSCSEAEEPDPSQPKYANVPIFKEIQSKLAGSISPKENPEQQIIGLQSLERLLNADGFLPDAPEQRDFVLTMLYGRYGILLPNLNERELYINRALRITKQHNLLIPRAQLYISLADNQAARGRPLSEQHKTMKKALLAAESGMDAGASAEAASLEVIAQVLAGQSVAAKDQIGLDKLHRRLQARGLKVISTMPGALHPEMN